MISNDNPTELETIRHSCAHLMAQAVQALFPGTQVTIGPVIEDGFFYDFSRREAFVPEDLEKIEKRMKELAAADTPIQFSFGDNNVTMVITYHDATMTIENPNGSGNWAPATPALVTITDPDMNLNPGDDETMNISDETEKIPTIKIGSPLTLDSVTAADGFPLNETASIDSETECIAVCMGGGTGQNAYTGHVRNVSDHSERLRIITSGVAGGGGDNTAQGSSTWLNITTSWP